MPFREQLELDSMDFLDIVMELRKRYRVQIPEEDYVQLASMDSTVEYLEPLMKDLAEGMSRCRSAVRDVVSVPVDLPACDSL